ncbi:MAG: hypothetical protein G01um10145_795 [Microgenomates group bacterium Gr01-1014_5]|nr:MAG: hypothetical protein G01um10145_795 [Microgenomates group bacterium Gr01-1014_5]
MQQEAQRRIEERQARTDDATRQQRPRGVIEQPMAGQGREGVDDFRAEIFGSGLAFTREWANKHNLPEKVVTTDPYSRVTHEYRPEEVFSELVETGLADPTAWTRANTVIDEAPSREFKIAARNGLLHAIIINIAMKSSRFDPLVATMGGEHGLKPDGMAQWLMVDTDTRRALTKIFELQGYHVPPTADEHGRIINDPRIETPRGINYKFSDFDNEDVKDPLDVRPYLDQISKQLNICPGVVTVAYTIFRALGFPHGNGKYHELYSRVIKDKIFNLNTDKKEVAPSIEKIKDPRDPSLPPKEKRYLAEVLTEEGVMGLARSLARLKELEIARYWQDMDMMLDVGDAVADIRAGVGGGLNLSPAERRATIIKFDKLDILVKKRRISDKTYFGLIDPNKISREKPVTKMGFVDAEKDFWSGVTSAYTPDFLKRGNKKKIG